MKKLHPMVQKLITEIEAYCRLTDTPPTIFGREALGDGNFMKRMRDGRIPTIRNMDRVRDFIRARTRAVRK